MPARFDGKLGDDPPAIKVRIVGMLSSFGLQGLVQPARLGLRGEVNAQIPIFIIPIRLESWG